ncbi:MAG: hypothetical protein AABY32_00470 [Nanoarchaeota archaeon]
MGLLDEINSMKNQGMGEKEILNNLQERGVTPKSIEDAFNQMKIKKAVSAESSGQEGMEPSIMKGNPKYEAIQAPLYTPKTQEIEHNSGEFYTPQPNEQLEAPKYGEYSQEEYSPREGYEESGGGNYNADTFIEIAEQVFLERIKKEQKQIAALNEFATLAETKISNDHERIKRIEEIIDKLQVAILEKIGSYGRNLDSIKNEMGMMQESFGKMVPSIHEHNQRQHHEKNNEKSIEKEFNEEVIKPLMKKKLSKMKK